MTVEPLTPSNTMSYDAQNRMTNFSGTGGAATYTYDDNDDRVQKSISGGTTTVYIYSGERVIAEYDNGAVPASPSREYIYANYGGDGMNDDTTGVSGGQLLAQIDSSGTHYFHQDDKSVRLITDSSGTATGQQGHFPFGESWYSSSGSSEWVFTTYQRDNESGLDYALERFYDSRVASFCSADPIEGFPEDPQSWNRYSYVEDDPINLTDPTGQSWLSDLWSVIKTVFDYFLGAGPEDPTYEGPPIIIPPPIFLSQNEPQPTQQSEQQDGQQGQTEAPPVSAAPNQTTLRLNCIQNALNALFPGIDFHQQPNTQAPTVGGHINGTFEADNVSAAQAQKINDAIDQADKGKLPIFDHGARFPSQDGGSVHLPSGSVNAPSPQSPPNSISVSGHQDRYNPRNGDLAGLAGHIAVDLIWGHIKQRRGGDLDRRCQLQ